MKKYLVYSVLPMLLAFSLGACKKDNNNADPSLFKNTNWTGSFNYAGKGPEPVSIEFSDGGTLIWHELLGEFSGSWTLTGNQLAISIDGFPSFKGTVSGSSLTGITSTDMGNRAMKSAELNKEDVPSLDGTKWGSDNVSLKFKAGSKLDLIFGPPANSPTYTDVTYVRSGKAVRFSVALNYDWFTVITSGTVMQGTNHAPNDPTVYGFQVKKQ